MGELLLCHFVGLARHVSLAWFLVMPLMRAVNVQVMEVEAFCGVHDMIHAAILSYGSQASLREVITSQYPLGHKLTSFRC